MRAFFLIILRGKIVNVFTGSGCDKIIIIRIPRKLNEIKINLENISPNNAL